MTDVSAHPAVILVGPLGVGRTSVGLELASALGAELSETEGLLETKWGKPLSEIILEFDPEEFRSEVAEIAIDQLVSDGPKRVVTLLPSALFSAAVQAVLAGHPRLVELRVPPSTLAKRVGLNVPQSANLGQPRAAFARFVMEIQQVCVSLGAIVMDNGESDARMTSNKILKRFAVQ